SSRGLPGLSLELQADRDAAGTTRYAACQSEGSRNVAARALRGGAKQQDRRRRQGTRFLRTALRALGNLAAWRGRGLRHRVLRACYRRVADADGAIQRAGLSPALEPVRARLQPGCA